MEELYFGYKCQEAGVSEEEFIQQLEEYCEKYGLTWREGYIKDIRLSTKLESFEFSLTVNKNDIGVVTMLHFPALGGHHNQFKKSLEIPLTVEEVCIYVSEHSKRKYNPRYRKFNKKVKEKLKGYI